jgi:hypothetical protein
MLSPTVFSVYVEVFLILALGYEEKFSYRIFYFLSALVIILLTRTRLNIIFACLIPFLVYSFENLKFSKGKFLIMFLLSLNLIYPLYTLVTQFDFIKTKVVNSRYASGRDASFGLRNYLNQLTYNEYLYENSLFQKLFGSGTESSRILIIEKFKYDILTHNDFIRFTFDFGIITTIFFILFLFEISKKNYISFLVLLLYLFSFYHNMIYDFFILSIIIITHKNNFPRLNSGFRENT